jgi:hypothetical protein
MEKEGQQWYVVTIIIKSETESVSGPFTCDEQIRMVSAQNIQDAFNKAIKFGEDEEVSYENADGEKVSWKFVGVESIEALEESIRDGIEIRSRMFGHNTPEDLIIQDSDSMREGNSKRSLRDEDLPAQD